jgi:cell wall-associated NlpC family hydrolase
MVALINKVNVKGSPMTGLARLILALALPLALSACMSQQTRESARPPGPSGPVPASFVPAEAPAAYTAPLHDRAGLVSTEAETGGAVSPPTSHEAALNNDHPAFPPQSSVFASGLINRDRLLAESFPGRLATAMAGERLLLAHGLTPYRMNEPDPMEAQNYPSLETASAALAPISASDPAPSAGEPTLTGVRPAPAGRLKAGHSGGLTKNLLTAAYEQTGRHYRLGGFSPVAGFDAPGYTRWVFAREGLNLPKTPAALAMAGTTVAKEDLRPGDVLIYRNPIDQVNGWHVGIYSGQGTFLHASPKAGVVTETDAFGPQYAPYFLSGRRFFDDPEAAPLSDDQKMAATSTAVKLALAELGPNDKIVKPAQPKSRSKAKSSPKTQKAVKK